MASDRAAALRWSKPKPNVSVGISSTPPPMPIMPPTIPMSRPAAINSRYFMVARPRSQAARELIRHAFHLSSLALGLVARVNLEHQQAHALQPGVFLRHA